MWNSWQFFPQLSNVLLCEEGNEKIWQHDGLLTVCGKSWGRAATVSCNPTTFLQTKSSPTTLLSSGAQLKILRGCCEAMVCKSERCSGQAVTQWGGFGCHGLELMAYNVRPLHDILTRGKLPFGFQSPHKLWKHWPVTNSDDVTWPVFTVKLWGIRADPITARPRVSVRASRLPVGHSPTSLDSKKQFEWDSSNAVQRRWGLSLFWHIGTTELWA